MSYIHYFCLFAHSGVQHILCCVFVLFFFVHNPMLPVSLDCPFLIALLYSLTFICSSFIIELMRNFYLTPNFIL
jgi:hypothetical protein